MKTLLLWLLLAGLTAPLQAMDLSRFVWDDKAEREGLHVEGPLSWQAATCDFTQNDFVAHDFPVFSYKGPSGKPRRDPTGAYCFQIEIPSRRVGSLLHFSMIRVFGNAELWIQGERVWFQDSATGPQRLSVLHELSGERMNVELRLRCNEAPSCGFRGALHLMEERQGPRAELLHASYDLLALTGMLACLFYHLIFAFLRRRSSAALFLSINALALFLRLLLTGYGQLHYVLSLPETWYWRLEILAVFLLLPSTTSLVKAVFERESPSYFATLAWCIAGMGSLFLILDARIFLFLLALVYLLVALNLINFAVTIPKAFRNHRSGSIILIVSAGTTFISTLFEVLNSRLNIEMHAAMQPLSYLAVMIFQSVLLATRINDAFTLAEQQETEIKDLKEQIEIDIKSLDQRILERTTELRTILQSISTGILWIRRQDNQDLTISSEYSDHLRKIIGFDIEAWHEMHFFLRRMRLPGVPRSGKELALWLKQEMDEAARLDQTLEQWLGGVRVFDDLDRVKHLKFKWIPIIEDGRASELFIFVFDVTQSMEMQDLMHYKSLEIEALRELTRIPHAVQEALYIVFGNPSLPAIQKFAADHQLAQLARSLAELHPDRQLPKFMQAYRRILDLLLEREARTRQQRPFDLEAFLQHPDWRHLPADTRDILQALRHASEK